MTDSSLNEVLELMANMINYLNVSLYEAQFTLKHEQSRRRLNEIYDSYSLKTNECPTVIDITEFYMNVKELINVTDTDDPDYTRYMRLLRRYIRLCDA
jgi:hydrogenase maturation factor HypF (carbamoyltransferase family)